MIIKHHMKHYHTILHHDISYIHITSPNQVKNLTKAFFTQDQPLHRKLALCHTYMYMEEELKKARATVMESQGA